MARPIIFDRPDKLPQYTPACVELGLREIGIDAKLGPKEAVCRCCFHADSGKPNLYVNIDDKPGVYHCFACGARGGFETLVREYTGWSLPKTILTCRQWAKVVVNDPPRLTAPVVAPLPQEDRLAPYRWRHPYVYSRGLVEETAQRFDIGYDRKQDCITLPWFAGNGTLIAIKRRAIQTKYYIFEQGADLHTTLFGLQHVRQHAFVWLVEGEFDAMYFDQCLRLAHFTNHHVVALGGKYLHNKQIDALCRREPQRVVLLLDNDAAGREAQAGLSKRLLPRVKVTDATYPANAHDPNALTFEQVVELARSIETKG